MMRPSSPGPTGTEIGAPVSVTSWLRTRPSVTSMAMVRTVDSPRCCATSSTRRLPPLLVSSEFRIAGRSPSNCTSTTAPITWVTRPVLFIPACAIFVLLLISALKRLGAGDDLDQFLRDHRLTGAVILDGLLADHVAGVARRIIHRRHLRAIEGGIVLQQRAENLGADI